MFIRVRKAVLLRMSLYEAGCWEQSFEIRLHWEGPTHPVLDPSRIYMLSNWPSGFIMRLL